VAKPVSLPDWRSVPQRHGDDTEYASMTARTARRSPRPCFRKIKSEFIDSGKIRFVFREFPLDINGGGGFDAGALHRKDDSGKYFAVVDLLFKQQNDWVTKNTTETLTRIGKQAGLSQQAVEIASRTKRCSTRSRDQKFASEVLKVNSTPPFFHNGEMVKGETSFEEFDKKISRS